MADTTDVASPPPPQPKREGGVFLSGSVILTLALAFAALVATYIFATKAELALHAMHESERTTVVEQTVKHHDEQIGELKEMVKAVDQNVRTLMTEQGVPANKIAVPKEKQ